MQKTLETKPIVRTLENGLTIILVPMPVRSVTVLAMVGTGSRYETESTSGISHFLEHMVFKGTKNYPTPKVLAEAVDQIGAEFNAFTSKEYTGYYVKAASEFTHVALNVVSDMLLTPILRSDDLEREKGVIVEEIHMYEDTPARHIGDVFERMMFAGSSLGRDIIGTETTVRSFTRGHFEDHLRKWYGLSNIVVTVAGDASVVTEKFIETIEVACKKLQTKRELITTAQGIQSVMGKPLSTKETIHVAYKDTQQAHFVMAHEGLMRKDPDEYAASILGTVLGGNMSSRLFTEVREKRGLCYYVRSDDDSYHDVGIFGASAGVDPKRVEEAVSVIREQFRFLLEESGENALTKEEIEKAKSHDVGSMVLHTEDSMAIAQYYCARQLLRGEVTTPEEEIEKIKSVTHEQVQAVAKRIFSQDRLYFAVIGPYKEQGIFEQALK